jgi:hypothetical protein
MPAPVEPLAGQRALRPGSDFGRVQRSTREPPMPYPRRLLLLVGLLSPHASRAWLAPATRLHARSSSTLPPKPPIGLLPRLRAAKPTVPPRQSRCVMDVRDYRKADLPDCVLRVYGYAVLTLLAVLSLNLLTLQAARSLSSLSLLEWGAYYDNKIGRSVSLMLELVNIVAVLNIARSLEPLAYSFSAGLRAFRTPSRVVPIVRATLAEWKAYEGSVDARRSSEKLREDQFGFDLLAKKKSNGNGDSEAFKQAMTAVLKLQATNKASLKQAEAQELTADRAYDEAVAQNVKARYGL